ncbi:MAG: hypothetical protein L0H41_17760, partial [Microlunatus sp.]|nr:hypothetical protein [Microlunatus sp.]
LARNHFTPKPTRGEPSQVDVVQLPVPAVYCDVVFTEQQWVRALTRDKDDKLDERFDTKLIFEPEQLVEVLVAASL